MQPNHRPDHWGLLGPALLLAVALGALGLRLVSERHLPRLAPGGLSANPAVAAAFSGAALILLLAGLFLSLRTRPQLGEGALGRARRARSADLSALRSRLWPPLRRREAVEPRVRLGSYRRRPIRLPPEEHLLVIGPTGAGKSSAVSIPAILEWPGPVVVTDPKGELVGETIGPRQQLGEAAVFAPMMRPSQRWNPVSAIRSSEDALRTAAFLMGRPPEREPFWHELALQLLHGLLVEESTRQGTLAAVLSMLQLVEADELAELASHPLAQRLIQGSLSGGDRTAMGVVATLVAKLGAFGAESVAAATAASDFDPAQLASGELRTLYCVVTPHDAPLLRGLLSALLSASWRAIYAAPPRPPVLFVLDEFAQLTCLSELPALVQLGRSQGVRVVLMAQDLSSVSASYGADSASAIWSNCRTKLVLPGVSELELLDRLSRLAGSATLHRPDHLEAVSAHPLLPPDEIRRLAPGRALLLRGSDHPAVIRQRPWFSDRRLRRLVGASRRSKASLSAALGTPLNEPRLAPRPAQSSPLGWRVGDEGPESD